MQKLAQFNKSKLIDVLNERLTFERAGVRLYDSIIDQVRGSSDPRVRRLLTSLEEYRSEEKEHEEWLEEQIRALGGDAHGRTEMSDLVERESQGLEEVVMHDTQVPHQLHALLTAELADNAGWDVLIQLADQAEDDEALRAFKKRMHEEEEHLIFARRAVIMFTRNQVMGPPQPSP